MKIAHLVSSKIFAGIEQHVYELSSFMSEVSDQVIICDDEINHHMNGIITLIYIKKYLNINFKILI